MNADLAPVVTALGAREHRDQGRTQPKTLTPSAKREAIRIMTDEHGLPIVRACQVARLSRAAYYKSGIDWAARDGEVIAALQAIVVEEQRWGFWKCHDRLRAQGYRPQYLFAIPSALSYSRP